MIYCARSKPPVGTDVDRRHPTSAGLLVYYLFNEAQGNPINIVGRRYDGIRRASGSNAPPRWEGNGEGPLLRWPAGIQDGWVECDLPGPRACAARVFTYVAFCTFEENVNFPTVLNEVNTGSATPVAQIYLEANSKLALFIRDDAGVSVNPAAVGPVVVDGLPHMVALVGDGGSAYLYLDGVLLRTQSLATLGGITTDQLIVGASRNAGNQFRGAIGQVLVWNRALAPEEILQLYRYPYSLCRVED